MLQPNLRRIPPHQPTEFEMRRRNEKFAKDVREGKKATHSSRADKLAQRSPISAWALGVVMFVVFGGGESTLSIHLLTCGFQGVWSIHWYRDI